MLLGAYIYGYAVLVRRADARTVRPYLSGNGLVIVKVLGRRGCGGLLQWRLCRGG